MSQTLRGAEPRSCIEDAWRVLDTVLDPEVPALSVRDLGIVRDVRRVSQDAGAQGQGAELLEVVLTPTYSGCPATEVISQSVREALEGAGHGPVRVTLQRAPAWTTDWISPAGREKLRAYGIAPPGRAEPQGLIALTRARAPVACPFCGSRDTRLQSEFGSTACKAIHVCQSCRQPFDEFKAF